MRSAGSFACRTCRDPTGNRLNDAAPKRDQPALGELQAGARVAFADSIGVRPRRTYGTGERHWDAFRREYVIPDFGQGGDGEGNAAAFLVYLVCRGNRPQYCQ